MKPAEQWKLLELWERARDGRLDEAEMKALNQAILENPEARRLLAEAALMDAELRLGGMPDQAAAPKAAPAARTDRRAIGSDRCTDAPEPRISR